MTPTILDLCCCEGGAAVGYYRAGLLPLGVDMLGRFRKRYPFEFHEANALHILDDLVDQQERERESFDCLADESMLCTPRRHASMRAPEHAASAPMRA